MKTFGYLAALLVLAAFTHASPLGNSSKANSGDTDEVVPTDEATPQVSSTASLLNQETVGAVVGAAMGDNDCLKRTACHAGSYVSDFGGKELVIMLMDRYVPDGWQDTLKAFKDSAIYKDDCRKQFKCKAI